MSDDDDDDVVDARSATADVAGRRVVAEVPCVAHGHVWEELALVAVWLAAYSTQPAERSGGGGDAYNSSPRGVYAIVANIFRYRHGATQRHAVGMMESTVNMI